MNMLPTKSLMVRNQFQECRVARFKFTLIIGTEECERPFKFQVSLAVCNIATDVFIILVTVPMFWKSRIPMKKKVPIIFLFSLGLVTVSLL